MAETTERRAVKIAAVIMYRAGLCRHESPTQCRRTQIPTEWDCVRCIEKWLIRKARSETAKEVR